MLHELTITVDDTVYEMLKPMVEQQTISAFLHDFLQSHPKNIKIRQVPDIKTLRGTLDKIDTSDLREENDRPL
jgi:predicted CopG family antitoxin